MTREENIRSILECNFSGFKDEIIDIAVNAILNLKDEPCEDCISRAELIDKTIKRNSIWLKITDSRGMNLQEIIDELPSIQPKIGHWVVDDAVDCYLDKVKCHCSECGKKKVFPAHYNHIKDELYINYNYPEFIDNFCPNCGAKMVVGE